MAKDQEIGAKDALAAELRASLDQARAEISETRMEVAALKMAAEQADAAARTAEARVAELETAESASGGLGGCGGGLRTPGWGDDGGAGQRRPRRVRDARRGLGDGALSERIR
jgi:hypothetical protein